MKILKLALNYLGAHPTERKALKIATDPVFYNIGGRSSQLYIYRQRKMSEVIPMKMM